ncbi:MULTISPECIES: sodium/proline symporter PutP [Marinobacter]|uniref:Sodium/proline symporter n=1 Tax=Marinobacter xestospongiae TaxID=994319 RepID=A0ABU3VXJ3_9GAMM|nr:MULTISPECIES: sodium/proline symporter PutP [Marinobacter]MCG8518709.1 sodium/proline symporter PutP [Pseudomonadales bacterium]MCK7565878.1 sodium/proline symporter PutP [Marinobacter xestospongiae]MDV2079005.1 sodium/proline symporter PutP [Marinobacter xestospongiae]UDL06803.1 sodium/proline symporter PutP [Marinobacter sp. CA1]
MIEGNIGVSLTFIFYILLMLGVGYVAYRRTSNLSDYILGGRSLGPLPSALSAGASDMSGWLLLGLPGYAYAAGYEAVWIAIGLLAGTWLNWLFVARRLRTYSLAAGDSLTLPSFFENRFHDTSRILRVVSAFFILLFFLFYTSSGLVAGGKLFETVFGLDYTTAVVIGTLAVVSYTFFGGFLAVAWTDVIQGLLMFAALLLVPIIAINADGGWGATKAAMEAKNPEFLSALTSSDGSPMTVIAILSLLGWGLGYFGQPHILARFKAIRSEADIPAARRIAVIWSALGLFGALLVGFAAIGYFETPLEDGERAFILLVDALFHPVIAGILLAAILAAIMSTADSQLLVSSSALAEDFYKALFRREASQGELVWVGRLAVVGIAVIACALAFDPDSKVLELVSYAWAGFGAAFGPALILSLYWKRMTRAGAVAGIVVGGATVVIWGNMSGGILDLYEIIPGFILATIAIVAVSLAGGEPPKETQDAFDQAMGS